MILRIWHGYTLPENAEIYENLLKREVFISIENKNVKGYRGIQLLRPEVDGEVEFTTIMRFHRIESVKQFAGENYETAYVPEKARNVLSRFDGKAIHLELRYELEYDL